MEGVFIIDLEHRFATNNDRPLTVIARIDRTTEKAILIRGYDSNNTSREIKFWLPLSCLIKKVPAETIPVEIPLVEPKTTKKLVSLIDNGRTLKIEFAYNAELVSNIKTIEGRRFDGNTKSWTIPASLDAIQKLKDFGFEVSKEIEKTVTNMEKPVFEFTAKEVEGIQRELYPFQKQGVNFLLSKNGRGLVADEMGLGKTIQALGYLQATKHFPAVIICPASLKFNWKKEIEMTLSPVPKVQVLSSQSKMEIADVYIINYDIIKKFHLDLVRAKPKVVIADEAHYMKNQKAQRTKYARVLIKSAPHFIALTGTPILSRPMEIFTTLQLLAPTKYSNKMRFGQRYCNATYTPFGWNFSGASRVEELHAELQPLMIRRLKKDVLTELPEKTRSIVPIELVNRKLYDSAADDFISFLESTKGTRAANAAKNAEHLVKIEALKQLAVGGKLQNIYPWVHEHLEISEKLVIMAVHKEVIEALMTNLKEYNPVKIDGSTTQQQRQQAVDTFQNDPNCRLFIGNIKAAGVGLTLTAADTMAIIQLPWTPGELDQAEDRIHRIGQRNASTIYYLVGIDTIEETIANLLDKKRKVVSSILDGQEPDESSLIKVLLEELTKQRKGKK